MKFTAVQARKLASLKQCSPVLIAQDEILRNLRKGHFVLKGVRGAALTMATPWDTVFVSFGSFSLFLRSKRKKMNKAFWFQDKGSDLFMCRSRIKFGMTKRRRMTLFKFRMTKRGIKIAI